MKLWILLLVCLVGCNHKQRDEVVAELLKTTPATQPSPTAGDLGVDDKIIAMFYENCQNEALTEKMDLLAEISTGDNNSYAHGQMVNLALFYMVGHNDGMEEVRMDMEEIARLVKENKK